MNILILKDGDISSAIMATPALRALHEKGHDIYLLINSGPDAPEIEKIFEDAEYIKEVKGFNSTREKNGDTIISWTVQRSIDICIELFPPGSSFKWLYPYLHCDVIRRAPKELPADKHEVDFDLEMVADLLGESSSTLYDIPRYKFDSVDDILSESKDKIRVIICPNFKKNGIDLKKSWGVGNYAKLINLLPPDFQAILVDDSDGIGVCNFIKHLAPQSVNLAGSLSLKECIAIIDLADVVISNNSYFAHLASGLNKLLMVFFDEKSLEKSRPIGPKAIILKPTAPEHECSPMSPQCGCYCIASIPPESVYNAIVKYILPEIDKEKKVQPIGV